jgi:hypothetical protein
MRLDVRSAARNPISLVGVALTTATAVVFFGLLALELGGQITNPYFGLVLFVAVPIVFILGLLLIPLGIWRQRRQVAAGEAVDEWPVVDLRLPRTRTVVFAVAMLTIVNLMIVSLAAYGALHHMESVEFCGTTCHTTMEPEWMAHKASPHANVACVQCHVGAGAKGLVQSKINGTRQLWQVVTNNVPTPVDTPVHNLPTTGETCANCHWPEKTHGDKLKQIREYADDEASSETITTLQLHVGNGGAQAGSGIHWHSNPANRIEYIATDADRQVIPWVKMTDASGKVTEFVVEGTTPADLAKGEHRVMDCLDCHNRPAHTFALSTERAVDTAIARGNIARELPFARREAVAALKTEYPTKDAALAGIDAKLREVYKPQAGSSAAALARTVAGVQGLYASNVFPKMKVGWATYPNNLGHMAFQGCFRCHDDNHKATSGKTIAQDCESCHSMQ